MIFPLTYLKSSEFLMEGRVPAHGPPAGPSHPNTQTHPSFTCPVRPCVDMLSSHGTQMLGSVSGLYESAGHAEM